MILLNYPFSTLTLRLINVIFYVSLKLFQIVVFYLMTGDNTKKIWVHRFYAKQKTDVPKARKMAAGGLGSAVTSAR